LPRRESLCKSPRRDKASQLEAILKHTSRARSCAGHPRLKCGWNWKDVDGRDKPGHGDQ